MDFAVRKTLKTAGWLLVTLLTIAFGGESLGVVLEWDPNPEPEVAGYIIYFGVNSRDYFVSTNVGPQTSGRLTNLEPGVTYFFAVTAYSFDGLESEFSEEVNYTVPLTPPPPPPATNTNAVVQPVAMTMAGTNQDLFLSFMAVAGKPYRLQYTEDFQTWTTLESATPTEAAAVVYRDADALKYPRRFYRVLGIGY